MPVEIQAGDIFSFRKHHPECLAERFYVFVIWGANCAVGAIEVRRFSITIPKVFKGNQRTRQSNTKNIELGQFGIFWETDFDTEGDLQIMIDRMPRIPQQKVQQGDLRRPVGVARQGSCRGEIQRSLELPKTHEL